MGRWSKYNYLFSKEGKNLLYNSLSNSFAEISDNLCKKIKENVDRNDIAKKLEHKEIVDYLIRIKAIVDDDDFEISKIRYANMCRRFNNKYLNLTINPTLGCNFACPYCFEGEHVKSPRMTDDVEDAIIQYIKQHECAKLLHVTWFGGEPFLEFARIKTLTRKMQNLGLVYSASIITNGFLITANVAKELESLDIKSVQVTIDGVKNTHDKRRYLKGGKPTFDIIINNIKQLVLLSPKTKVSIRVNIDEENERNFVELYNFISGLHLANVMVYPAFVKDYSDRRLYSCALDASKQYAFFKKIYHKYGVKTLQLYPNSFRYECGVRNLNMVSIGPNGELYKCWSDIGNPEKVFGSVFGGVYNEKVLMDYLVGADSFEDPKCKKCLLLPVCSGGCPHDRLHKQNGGDDEICPLIKHNIEDYLWLHYLYKIGNGEK